MSWGTVRIQSDSKDRLEDLADLLGESQSAIVSDLVDARHREFFEEDDQIHIRHTRGESSGEETASEARFQL